MVSSGVPALDALLGGQGYPDRSAVLVVGPPGIGKEALAYWFTYDGLAKNDFSLYVTRLSAREVLRDAKAFNVDFSQRAPFWISGEGGQVRFDASDLANFSFNVKDILKRNPGRRVRIVVDVLSSLLMLNPPETIYKFLTQLFAEIKTYDAILIATMEEGMHKSDVQAAMQQLFDGFIEMSFYRSGLDVIPLFRIGKMSGVAPQPSYFRFRFGAGGLSLERASRELGSPVTEQDFGRFFNPQVGIPPSRHSKETYAVAGVQDLG